MSNADRYIPICAGTMPSEVFVTFEYHTSEKARGKPEFMRERLDYDYKFRANEIVNCYPLMFRLVL